MRKTLIGLAGAAALAISSAASATVTVTASSGLSPTQDPFVTPSLVTNNADGTANIAFGIQPVPSPFSGSFAFTNTAAGLYNIVLQTSTTGVLFTSAVISGGACTPAACTLNGLPGMILSLFGLTLAANTSYTFNFGGTNSNSGTGTLNGNVSISPVPEAATWAMMLLGFGAIGLTIRGRRRQVIAQVA